jgi:hypothetical protein
MLRVASTLAAAVSENSTAPILDKKATLRRILTRNSAQGHPSIDNIEKL